MSLERPLSHYRVLEIGTGAAALCGRLLADLGAEVVTLEPPEGDVMRSQRPLAGGTGISFLWYNANKIGATANLSDESSRTALLEALASFDVLIDGNEPGWLAARGLAPPDLLERFPELIITSVSHFGQTGPYRDWQGSALVDFAIGGSLFKSGLADKAPTAPPYLLPYAIGGVSAASATMAALWDRGRTGNGDWLDCSTTEAVQSQNDWSSVGYSATGNQAKRAGAGPVFRVYPADDGWARVLNLTVKQWQETKKWVGDPPEISGPEWDSPMYRAANPETLDLVFDRVFEGRTKSELYHDGQANGVGVVPIYSPTEVQTDEHFTERGTFVPLDLPDGTTVQAPGAFVRMNGARPTPPTPAPALGGDISTLAGQRNRQKPVGGGGPPLNGIRVIEVGSGAVAPEIARLLGAFGADVIKLESMSQIDFMRLQAPDRESSAAWSSSSRNKRSVLLDLKHPQGAATALRLAAEADILVENNKHGVMDRLGLGYEVVAKANPSIVYLSSQAFGATGPSASYGGFGPTNQAVSGTTYLWNHAGEKKPEGTMAIHPDHLLGRMGSLVAVAALDEVRRTGQGQQIDLGQAEFAIACIAEAFIESGVNGATVEARGNQHAIGAPHGVFPSAGDDEWIAITVESDDQWEKLKAVVEEDSWDNPVFATVEGRLAERDVIEAQLAAWTGLKPAIVVMRVLQTAGIPAGAAYTTTQVISDVQFAERQYFQTVVHPVLGALRMEGNSFIPRAMELATVTRAPLFGEHTRMVFEEWLGMDAEEYANIERSGALT